MCVCVCVCVCVGVRVCVCARVLDHVRLFATPQTVDHQASLLMEFCRQEYWNRQPFPSPEDLPYPRIKPTSPVSPALAGRFFTNEPPGKTYIYLKHPFEDIRKKETFYN